MPIIDLKRQLDTQLEEFTRTAPPGRAAMYSAKIEELRGSFGFSAALKEGDEAPEFSLPSAHGVAVSLSDVLKRGPAVMAFYRGGWCPYCNLQLRAYQALLPELEVLGASLLAISPQLPDESLSTTERNALTFEVLSDVGNSIARRFGLVYALQEPVREAMRSNGKHMPAINGDDSWELPLPATFVIAPNRRVTLAFIDADDRRRLSPERILEALRTSRAA